jgi:hypothetical protein
MKKINQYEIRNYVDGSKSWFVNGIRVKKFQWESMISKPSQIISCKSQDFENGGSRITVKLNNEIALCLKN